MKKPEWIFVGAIILVSSYFIYNYLSKKDNFKDWDLVPSNAALVYESKSAIDIWNKLVESDLWESIGTIEDIHLINNNLQLLDTLSGGNGQLAYLLNSQNIIISAHVTSQNSFGLTYYISLGNSGYTAFINLLDNAQKLLKIKKSQRVYQAQTIYELKAKDKKISYMVYKNTLIISTNAFLVEDVVRNIQSKFKNNFIRSFPKLRGNPSFTTDDGNLFVNGNKLPMFAKSFQHINKAFKTNYTIASSLFFDLTLNKSGFMASGFAFEGKEKSLATTFKDQQAQAFNLMHLIPKNTASLEHFASSNFNLWYKNWLLYQKEEALEIQEAKKFMSFIKNEMAYVTLQSVNSNQPDKLFIAELSDKEGIKNHLNKIAEEQVAKTTDSLYVEFFADNEIRLIDNDPVLQNYFGRAFNGFGSTYYLIFDNYLVIANNAEALRNWLIQIENEETWGKSVKMNSFFKDMLTEANYTYVSNVEYSWNMLLDEVNDTVKGWALANSEPIKDFNLMAFQISNLDNRYYANFNLKYSPRPVIEASKTVFDIATIQLVNKIIAKPKVVKNHTNGALEILAQDSLNNLMLISESGVNLWEDSLGVKVNENIEQLDYYKNNKLQYLITADSLLFVIDRLGKVVHDFPIRFDYKINQAFIIDYDRSKNYRFLISDYFGNLRMYDKEGKILDGWNPNAFNSTLTDNIFHIRVRGIDRILVPLVKGVVHLTNRRGEDVKGFPLDLEINISNEFFFSPGESFDDSKFTTVSKDGLVVRFTMNGEMLSRNQLFKESSQSNFQLVAAKQGGDYVFIRNDINRLAVLSSQGDVLFEKDYMASIDRKVQYYNFGADRKLFVVKNDTSIYLYNQFGKLLNNIPLISDFPISVVYLSNDNLCQIYLSHNNTIEIKQINF